MKKNISELSLLFVLFFGSSVYAHQLKFSSTLVEYVEKSNKLDLMFNVFMDDFVYSVDNFLSKELDYISPSASDKKDLKIYFDTFFKISVNGIPLNLKFQEVEIHSDYNAFRFKFSCKKVNINKGDEIFLDNNLLVNEFGYQQTNMSVIRMAPFFEEQHYQSTFKNTEHKIKINLK